MQVQRLEGLQVGRLGEGVLRQFAAEVGELMEADGVVGGVVAESGPGLLAGLFGEGEKGVFEDVLKGLRDDPKGPQVDLRKELLARGRCPSNAQVPRHSWFPLSDAFQGSPCAGDVQGGKAFDCVFCFR